MADIWIIRRIGPENGGQPLRREFEISDAGRAILLHMPHNVWAPLVGFEAALNESARKSTRHWSRFLRRKPEKGDSGASSGVIRFHEADLLKDLDFSEYTDIADHIKAFRAALSRRSPVLEELRKLDLSKISEIRGLYPSVDGTVQAITISGTPLQQRYYIEENFGRTVEIQIDPGNSYESNLALRLNRKFFSEYNQRSIYRLELEPGGEGKNSVTVYRRNKRVMRATGADLINRLFMIQHAVDLDETFRDSLRGCLTGGADPLKLTVKSFYIGQAFDKISSSTVLEGDFNRLRIPRSDREKIINRFRGSVLLCILSYRDAFIGGAAAVRTVGAVLHNLSGVSGIEKDYPELVQSIKNRSSRSQLGEYYLFSGFESSDEPDSSAHGQPHPAMEDRT